MVPDRCRFSRAASAGLLVLSLLALSGCGGGGSGNGGNTPEPPQTLSPGLGAAPAVSTSGRLSLEQYDRDAKPTAAVSRSTRYTLIPEGATP